MAIAGECHAGGAALVHDCGHSAVHTHHIGIQAKTARNVPEDMGMGVDEAGKYKLARHIHGGFCSVWRDICLDCCDLAIRHRDVENAVAVRGWTYDTPPLQHKIIGRNGIHGELQGLKTACICAYSYYQ